MPDGLLRQQREIANVARDNRPAGGSGVRELGPVVQLGIPNLVGADCVNTVRAEHLCNLRGEVLVQIKRHPTRATLTSPGYSRSTTSDVSAAFSSIARRISSG